MGGVKPGQHRDHSATTNFFQIDNGIWENNTTFSSGHYFSFPIAVLEAENFMPPVLPVGERH